MHEYNQNCFNRKWIIVGIAIISLFIVAALSPLFSLLVSVFISNINNPYLIVFGLFLTVGYSTIFGALYALFNHFLWKLFWKNLNISGVYKCDGKSYITNDNAKFEWNGTIKIIQRWDKIQICLDTEQSSSYSFVAKIEKMSDGKIYLHYIYRNEFNEIDKKLQSHTGTTEIIFNELEITGKYYNYPGERKRFGTMIWTKENTKK